MNGTQYRVAALSALLLLSLGAAAGAVQLATEDTASARGPDGGSAPPDVTDVEPGTQTENYGERQVTDTRPGGGGSDSGGSTSILASPVHWFVLVLLAAAVAAVAVVAARDDGTPEGPSEGESRTEDSDDATLEDVGEAAGRAADRMSGVEPENAIYAAWAEMTGLLDVDHPGATTPREFAEVAVDAGLDPDDVAALTDAFSAVRYGDGDVTGERERRAREALRRIEAEHADAGAPSDRAGTSRDATTDETAGTETDT